MFEVLKDHLFIWTWICFPEPIKQQNVLCKWKSNKQKREWDAEMLMKENKDSIFEREWNLLNVGKEQK